MAKFLVQGPAAGRVLDRLEAKGVGAEQLVPLFVTVDPHRDTVRQVAGYLQDFHPRFVGLTGTPAQVAAACRAYRVYHSRADEHPEDDMDYLVDHTIIVYLIGPDGEVAGKYRKICLPRGEVDGGFTPGEEYPVFTTRFGRVGLMVCYDGFFPEIARELANRGAVHSFPTRRSSDHRKSVV